MIKLSESSITTHESLEDRSRLVKLAIVKPLIAVGLELTSMTDCVEEKDVTRLKKPRECIWGITIVLSA